jgi:hypothetical protein
MAEDYKDYVITSHIKIDGSGVTKKGFKLSEWTAGSCVERMRGGKGDFSLIEVEVDKKHLLIIASDVCVVKEPVELNPMEIPEEYGGKPSRELIHRMNMDNMKEFMENDIVIVGHTSSPCTPIPWNWGWI